jgi:hypothetical protein
MQRGVLLARSGDWRRAAAEFDEAAKAAPDWADAHYTRGVAHAELAAQSVSAEALATPDETHDYASAQRDLKTALEELRTYARLSESSPVRADVTKLVADYRARSEAIADAQATVEERHDAVEAVAKGSRRSTGWWLTGFGVAAGAGAVVLAVVGSNELSKIHDGGFARAADIDDARREGDTLHTVALGLGAGAIALCGIGVPLVLLNLDSGRPARAQVGAIALPAGAGLAVTGMLW